MRSLKISHLRMGFTLQATTSHQPKHVAGLPTLAACQSRTTKSSSSSSGSGSGSCNGSCDGIATSCQPMGQHLNFSLLGRMRLMAMQTSRDMPRDTTAPLSRE